MSLGRLLLVLVVVAIGLYLYKNSAGVVSSSRRATSPASAPIERARAAARQSEERGARAESAKREADSTSGAVTENMTPDQVRSLLGAPTEIETETTETGARREKWIYRSAGKTVVFESGIAVSVR